MKTRRGSLTGTGASDMIMQYRVGDTVKPTTVADQYWTGVVSRVEPRINKVWVKWAGGNEVQHDPDELMPGPCDVKYKIASTRRGTKIADEVMDDEVDAAAGMKVGASPDLADKVLEKVQDTPPMESQYCNCGDIKSQGCACGCQASITRRGSVKIATGEMGMHDIQEGGEYYGWAQEHR